MPQLDVGFVLQDPLLSSRFDVERRTEVVGSNGRTQITSIAHPKQTGVVTPADPDKLERVAEGQTQPKGINVRTRFALRDAAQGTAPDIIIYAGSRYEVKSVRPWKYGAGWFTALATSITVQDPPEA